MPFQQVDENTVMDDEGNKYYMPFPTSASPPGLTPTTTEDTGPGSKPGSPVEDNLNQIPQVPEYTPPPQTLPSTQAPQNPYGAPQAPAGPPDFALPLQAKPRPTKAQEEASRLAGMGSDVTGFTAAGGTPKTDEEMARLQGGVAKHEEQTAKLKADVDEQNRQLQIEKTRTMADIVLGTADQYDKHVEKIQAESKAQWDDWKKRSQEASERLVDPGRAFHSGGVLSKINWGLYMFGAGLQGGDVANSALQVINKAVEDDMAAQKFDIENKQKGVNEERMMIQDQDKLRKDSVADWYFAKNLRLQAVGQQLDAKIAEIGLPAAKALNLLSARDMIEKEVLKGQQHVADHYFEQGQKKIQYAHEIYMERMKSQLRMNEEAFKMRLKEGDTLPTNTQLGLQMVNKATGQVVPGGKIQLKVKGPDAVKAGQLLSSANYEASQLRDAKQQLKDMSTTDIARGGTAEFASTVTELIQARAVRYNGHRLTDHDLEVSATEVLGTPVTVNNGVITNMARIVKQVGGTKEGMNKVFDRELRNLSTQTVNNLHPYIDSDTAEKYDIQYNVQETNVPEQSKEADDYNTALTKAAEGADVSDLKAPGPRSPYTTPEQPGPIDPEAELKNYQAERAKGRGNQGGLPRMPNKDEEKVTEATSAFAHAPVEDIISMTQAYLRSPKISAEAKHEIRLEAQEALKVAGEKEAAVVEEAAREYQLTHKSSGGPAGISGLPSRFSGGTTPAPIVDEKGAYTPAFSEYLHSGLVDEMRKRAGLEPRQR